MNRKRIRELAEKCIEVAALLLAAYALRAYDLLSSQPIQNAILALCGCVGLLLFMVFVMFAVKAAVYKNRATVLQTMSKIAGKLLVVFLFLLGIAGKMSFRQTFVGIAICFMLLLAGVCLPMSGLTSAQKAGKTPQKRRLYESRREQLDELVRRIKNDTMEEQTAICLSAEWGSGKTFFVERMCEQLEDHPLLGINMLDMENIDQLFQYVYSRISVLLQRQGYYVGIGSEFQRYAASFGEVIVGKSKLPELLSEQLFDQRTDYRTMKEHLSHIFMQAFSKERLVIVVDDLERCETDKAREYLRLIRELSTLPNTVVLFLADYQKLLSEKIISQEAANKFITEVLPLNDAGCEEIIAELGEKDRGELEQAIEAVRKCFERHDYLLQIRAMALENRNTASDEEKSKIERERSQSLLARQYFEQSMCNARKINMLRQQASRRLLLIEHCLKDEPLYAERVQARQQAFLISWVQTNLADEFMRMSQVGMEQYVREALAAPEDVQHLALRIMADDVWIEDDKHEVGSYLRQQCYECADHLIHCESALAGDAVWYVRPEEQAVDQARRGEPLAGEYDGYWRIKYLQSRYNGLDETERQALVRKTVRMMKEQRPREGCIGDMLMLMREQADVNLFPPGTLYHDMWDEVLSSVKPCELHGAGDWKNGLITLSVYWRHVKSVFFRMEEMLAAVPVCGDGDNSGASGIEPDSSGADGTETDGSGKSGKGTDAGEDGRRMGGLLHTDALAAEDLDWMEDYYTQTVARLMQTQFAAYPETQKIFAQGRIIIDELRAIQNVHDLLDAVIADEQALQQSLLMRLRRQNEWLRDWQGYTRQAAHETEQIEAILTELDAMDSPPGDIFPLIHENLNLIAAHDGDVHQARIHVVKLEGRDKPHCGVYNSHRTT